MTDSSEDKATGIKRRTVLKSAAMASAAAFVGVPAFSGAATADTETKTEEITVTWERSDESAAGVEYSDVLGGAVEAARSLTTSQSDVWNEDEYYQGGESGYLDDIDFDYATWEHWDPDTGDEAAEDLCASRFEDPFDGSDNPAIYQTRKFETEFDLPEGVSPEDVTDISLSSPVAGPDGNDIIPINDNFYVYLNDGEVGKGGTACPASGVQEYCPAFRVEEEDYGKNPELVVSDWWYFDGALDFDTQSLDSESNTLELIVEEVCKWGGTTKLDLSITYECETTMPLCADQDTQVGTVSVSDDGEALSITYEMDPEAGWLLYESHVDIGDERNDFHTNRPGNPKVGQFDLSKEHDGVTSYTYTVSCGDAALDDVASDAEELFIAAHAVVEPTDGCADFSGFEVGEAVEGLGTVNPVLDIESTSSVSGAEAVAQKEGETPATYGAPTGPGTGSSEPNGCLNEYGDGSEGFSDLKTKDAQGSHAYKFTFADGVSVSEFSVRMLDFGDLNSGNAGNHRVEMVAYDNEGDEADKQVLEYTSDTGTNPTDWTPVEGTTKTHDNLQLAGDGCSAAEGEPGNYVWSVSGDEIVEVELEVVEGTDPNIAFTDLCFDANDETAWGDGCDGERFVERGNWATYFTSDLCYESTLTCED